jgi:hypothetical protein
LFNHSMHSSFWSNWLIWEWTGLSQPGTLTLCGHLLNSIGLGWVRMFCRSQGFLCLWHILLY